jgi:two-component system, response regulator
MTCSSFRVWAASHLPSSSWRQPTSCAKRLKTCAASAKAGVSNSCSVSSPPCQADPVLLKQVFVNLLANALKFTRRREVASIEIGCREPGEEVVYFVKDNGVGFEMQYAAKLFGAFQRLHRVEDYKGTGVGLAIVQRIIHHHGGRVWAEALDILFCTGVYAERNIHQAPKVMLLDLKLPIVDGLDVLRRIKADAHTQTIPVMVLTSSREGPDIAESYHLGVNSYIVKPVDFEQFTEAVRLLGMYWLLLNQPPLP